METEKCNCANCRTSQEKDGQQNTANVTNNRYRVEALDNFINSFNDIDKSILYRKGWDDLQLYFKNHPNGVPINLYRIINAILLSCIEKPKKKELTLEEQLVTDGWSKRVLPIGSMLSCHDVVEYKKDEIVIIVIRTIAPVEIVEIIVRSQKHATTLPIDATYEQIKKTVEYVKSL